VVLLYFFFGQGLVRRVLPRRLRLRFELRDHRHLLKRVLRFERDRLDARRVQELGKWIQRLDQAMAERSAEAAQACLTQLGTSVEALLPPRRKWGFEFVEMVFVILTIVFIGLRGLFLQPFKIPTGSMQPTLYGIHFEATPDQGMPGPVARYFGFWNNARRYTDQVVERDGVLEGIARARPAIPFLPAAVVTIGGVEYRLPGTEEDVVKYCPKLRTWYAAMARNREPDLPRFRKGEVLARGYLQLGDHLFVNRALPAFREPRRGDIMVFETDGITGRDGQGLGGKFYIKRLVGLPGDTLRIEDHRLYVRPPGEPEFQLMDGEHADAFERLYSMRGGYRGYCHAVDSRSMTQYLRSPQDTFTLPPGEYFMLGDNSENSRDSRYWGTVPRGNLVGSPCMVWWPFSRRWGLVDRAEPLDFPTPPTMD
jgi:signal peptidase I